MDFHAVSHLDRAPRNGFTVYRLQQNINEKPYATTWRVEANFFPVVLDPYLQFVKILKGMTIFFSEEKLA